MARSSSPDAAPPAGARAPLLAVARESIAHGLRHDAPLPVDPADFAPALREPRASFVTLRRAGALRGCVGTLEARRPLVVGVACNAFGAAFTDPRFPRLRAGEAAGLEVHVSILGPVERLDVTCEAELLRALRPGVDGLVLRDGARGATFLPAVWESVADPPDFVRELRRKAGLGPDHWSATLEIFRYTVESVSD
jgi:AmmeMemoRadiSam system protein A